jgi:hypothetical protein
MSPHSDAERLLTKAEQSKYGARDAIVCVGYSRSEGYNVVYNG